MAAEQAVVDMSPWVKVIGSIVGWFFFTIVLGMLGSFIRHGFSIALANFLIHGCDSDQREKLVRWLAKPEIVLKELKEIDKKLGIIK